MSSGLPLNQSHTHNFLDLVLANEFAAGKRIRINNTDINSNPFKPATSKKRKQPKIADSYTSLNHVKNSNIKRHWQINSLSGQAILFASLPGVMLRIPACWALWLSTAFSHYACQDKR